MKKILISILLVLNFSLGFSQPGLKPEHPIKTLFSLIEELRSGIKNIVDKEKAGRLNSHLSYLNSDLSKYLEIRRAVTNYLNQKNYSNFDTLKIQEQVLELRLRLRKIGKRLELISDYINEDLQYEFRELADYMIYSKRNQWVFTDDLQSLVEGDTVDKVKLQKDGNRILKDLQKSLNSIITIRKSLKVRYNL